MCFQSFAQSINIGTPFLKNYSKKTYQAGLQNWDIQQNNQGLIFFANNQGLLQFDGQHWKCYPLPNKTILRSIAIDDSGIIYAGGQNEMGFYKPDSTGNWAFHSIRSKISTKNRDFEDVWDIEINSNGTFFRTSNKLYQYTKDKIVIIKHPTSINYLGKVSNQIIFQDINKGLWIIKDNTPHLIKDSHSQLQASIVKILLLKNNNWLIITKENGIFEYDNKVITPWYPRNNKILNSSQPNTATLLLGEEIAIGTSFDGIIILNQSGKIIHHINKNAGLLNNHVLSIHTDKDQHLWLGLDNGINHLLVNSPFGYISPDGKEEGAGYDVSLYQDNIFFATANGLFRSKWKNYFTPFEKEKFSAVPNTKGLTWGIDNCDQELLLGHHLGAFNIDINKANNLYIKEGVWTYQQSTSNPDLLIAGTYTGLAIFYKKNKTWVFKNKVLGFEESSRFLEQDENGNIWVAHPYKGIFKITLDENFKNARVKKYGAKNGLSTDFKNYIFKIGGELIFCSANSVYAYDSKNDTFLPYDEYNRIFKHSSKIIRLYEAKNGDIWFITDKEWGVLNIQNKGLNKEINKKILPKFIREQMVGGFELIVPINQENVFIGTESGFIHYDIRKEHIPNQNTSIFLSRIALTSNGDSTISNGIYFVNGHISFQQPEGLFPTFNHHDNSFQFEFSSIDLSNTDEQLYQYYLEGLDNKWSSWTHNIEKEYTNLAPGSFTFKVKSRTANGKASNETSYTFTILPPWYASNSAKMLYVLLLSSVIGLIILLFFRKYSVQKEMVLQSGKEITRLENEKLELEVANKNRVLASTAIYLQHKTEILANIKTQVEQIQKKSNNTEVVKSLSQVIKKLNIEENSEGSLKQFTSHFNEIHPGFYNRLHHNFPELSPKDLKLCAYLRMNLSTKEIASLTNNTVRGVEGGRYRLRKKMDLGKKINLIEFLMNY